MPFPPTPPRSRLPFIASLVFLGFLLWGVGAAAPIFPSYASSVVVLTLEGGQPVCSAFVINKAKRLVMTADHCMQTPDKRFVRVDQVVEIFHVPFLDVAILEVGAGNALSPALAPDPRPFTQAGQRAKAVGFANGTSLREIKLEVTFPTFFFSEASGPFVLLHPDIKFGMSGGPVIRESSAGNGVVGVNSMIEDRAKLTMQRPFEIIYGFTREFWELPPVGQTATPEKTP